MRYPPREDPGGRPPNADVHGFLTEALADTDVVIRSVPWCAVEHDSGDELLIYGFAYDPVLSPLCFYLLFTRDVLGEPRWEVGFDAIEESGESVAVPFFAHPCVGARPSATAWLHRREGAGAVALDARCAEESRETWQRVFDLVVGDAEAIALGVLIDRMQGSMHANGHNLDMLTVNTLGAGFMTEKGVASLMAQLLDARDGGARENYRFYYAIRDVDLGHEEITQFDERCAARGVRFGRAGER